VPNSTHLKTDFTPSDNDSGIETLLTPTNLLTLVLSPKFKRDPASTRNWQKHTTPHQENHVMQNPRLWAPGRAPASLHLHTCTVRKQTCMQLGNKYCDNHMQSRKIQIYTYPPIIDCYVRPGSTKSLGPPLDVVLPKPETP
jgi:hypothetical protein